VSDLSSDQYDVYTLLFHLNHKSHHDGVRDYLVHRLYQVAEEDIEAILPQLWSGTSGSTPHSAVRA